MLHKTVTKVQLIRGGGRPEEQQVRAEAQLGDVCLTGRVPDQG